MNSKIRQISTVFNSGTNMTILTVLCEDGTLWQKEGVSTWAQIQTRR